MRKIVLPTLLVLAIIIVMVPVEMASPTFTVTQATPTTTVYFDPPTINGTVGGQAFTVNITIRDADEIHGWQAGLLFNPAVLNCTGFYQGEFLSSAGRTEWLKGTINNETGVITPYGCVLYGFANKSGDGRLAYVTFEVIASGVSDLHFRDAQVSKLDEWGMTVGVPINIIDVYTVVEVTPPETVVIESNSTGQTGWYHSGFYAHAYNPALKTISFNVTGPKSGWSNVTIPKTLLNVTNLDDWLVEIDGNLLSTGDRAITENASHTFIYFTYSLGIHKVLITTRVSSVISIALSSASITLRSNVTISGNITASDPINPPRPGVNVTIQYRPVGALGWNTAGQNLTDSNSNYTYIWTPETGGTFEVMASWEGDEETLHAESELKTLVVIYVFEPEGVYIETNSTVSEFNSISAFSFNQTLKQISFNLTSLYGTTGFSNVTIPKTLLNVSSLDKWKVRMNGDLKDRNVTENGNTSIYFTYDTGNYTVQITTRIGSNISLDLSSDNIDLGSIVTLSGNITAEDSTMRPHVNVTISYKLKDVETWTTLYTETDDNGNYTYPWALGATGIYEVMTSWEGDEETIDAKSELKTLVVIENSTISIALSSQNINFGSSVTISGAIDPLRPGESVTIWYRPIGEEWSVLRGVTTYSNGSYSYAWTPDTPGTYEVKATWLGYNKTIDDKNYMVISSAESDVLTLTAKWNSTISIALSSQNITKGASVTISGNITAADNIVRENVTVTILYRLSGGNWTTLANVTTNGNGNYSRDWAPTETGTYEVKATWLGDSITFGAESDVLTLTVKEAGINPYIIVAVVVVIIIIAVIALYFVKFRKPQVKK